jgi:hypothetical protein
MKDTLVVFQCCKSKGGQELFPEENAKLDAKLPTRQGVLAEAVTEFTDKGIIDSGAPKITALSLYSGAFYEIPHFRDTVADELRKGSTDFLIMSAAYGLVHPFQRIQAYEQRMQREVTRHWIEVGLPELLVEYIQTSQIRRVYGFFSKSADYRTIFDAAPWERLPKVTEAGYFYLSGIQGTGKILRSLSRLFLGLLKCGFSDKPRRFAEAIVTFRSLRG